MDITQIEIIINDIRCATFHMNDEQAIEVIDEFIAIYPQLLQYHEKEWYYKYC